MPPFLLAFLGQVNTGTLPTISSGGVIFVVAELKKATVSQVCPRCVLVTPKTVAPLRGNLWQNLRAGTGSTRQGDL